MAYAVIDRRNVKVVDAASKKRDLVGKGLVVEVDHLEKLPKHDAELLSSRILGARSRVSNKQLTKLSQWVRQGAEPFIAHEMKQEAGTGAVATVKRITSEMDGQPREEILQACIAAGVKPNTARTQLYRWLKEKHPSAKK